jgi:hypothetical protein
MKDIQFKDLKVDDKFVLNGTEYTRIQDKRVSCCRVLNACNVANAKDIIQVKPLTMVQIND